ncbi:MAG: iron-containing alcohol dehydrogenase [Bdellovibrionota bacterium]
MQALQNLQKGSFRFPTKIRFGVKEAENISMVLRENGKARPLFVTDAGLAATDLFQKIVRDAEKSGLKVSVYSDARGNPVKGHVDAGVSAFKAHQADSLVIVGGGCALDVGKAIALMAYHPGDLFQYEDDMPGALPVDQEIPFMLALPTTAGTGSEVGASSVISDDHTHAKKIIYSPRLTPHEVIADPELTVGLPVHITAATGMDALTHNIEAYLAKNYHPMCDGIALEGIRLVFKYLHRAVETPNDLEARGGMLMASMMGAVAFQKGLGVTHSCAHALSTCYDTHHGLANALMLDACLRFNLEVVPDRFATMAKVVGSMETFLEAGRSTEKELGLVFIKNIRDLKRSLEIPTNLAVICSQVTDNLLDVAVSDSCHLNNPRPCSREDFHSLFLEAIKGDE